MAACADVQAQLDALGTNLLRVTPGETFFGDEAKLPSESLGMLRRVGPVERHVIAVARLDHEVLESLAPAQLDALEEGSVDAHAMARLCHHDDDLILDLGATLVEMTPDEHDRVDPGDIVERRKEFDVVKATIKTIQSSGS